MAGIATKAISEDTPNATFTIVSTSKSGITCKRKAVKTIAIHKIALSKFRIIGFTRADLMIQSALVLIKRSKILAFTNSDEK